MTSFDKDVRQIVTDQTQKEINNRKLTTKAYVQSLFSIHNKLRHNEFPKVSSFEEISTQYDFRERIAALERQVRCLSATVKEKPKEKKNALPKEHDTFNLNELIEEFLNHIPPGYKFNKTQKEYIVSRLLEVI